MGATPDTRVDPILEDVCDWEKVVKFPDISEIDIKPIAAMELKDVDRDQKALSFYHPCGVFERLQALMGTVEGIVALVEEPEACNNRHVVQGWIDSKLVGYLQARNPSVPAIPLKIYAPNARNLTSARRYWEEALSDHVFRDIYSGVPFDAAGCAAHGPMGVDHFIPWSFVLHDEPWNLAPMFRDANSSKGNRLPVIDEYLRPFCEQQFDALMTLRGTVSRVESETRSA